MNAFTPLENVPQVTSRATLPARVMVGTRATLASSTFAQWLQDRQKYVEGQGWCFGPDLDSYDVNPKTQHVIAVAPDDNTRVLGGLRLTPVEHAQHSLSWGMMTPAMQAVAATAPELRSTRALYDLTRLIPSQEVALSPREQMDVLCEIFGAAAGTTVNSLELNARWIFTTTAAFFATARRQGIFFNEIARSHHARFADQIVFCSIRPSQGINELLKRRGESARFARTAQFLMRGALSTSLVAQ